MYFGHYVTLLGGKFAIWLRNSAVVSICATTISITLGALGAYALTRLRFAGRRVVALGLVFTYLVPQALLFIPLFQVVATVGLSDTIGGLILVYPTITLPFCTWLLMSYFKSIPIELEDAAGVWLDHLKPRERQVLSYRFGLDGEPPLSLTEIGRLLHVSKERVRQIQNAALEFLRAKAREADSPAPTAR